MVEEKLPEGLPEEILGLDIVDILSAIKRRQGRYLALVLQDVEDTMTNKAEYQVVRKLVLDHFNDYTRSIFRIIIGEEVEGLVYR